MLGLTRAALKHLQEMVVTPKESTSRFVPFPPPHRYREELDALDGELFPIRGLTRRPAPPYPNRSGAPSG